MKELPYRILRPFFKAFFFLKYKPTIIGKENIPKNGAVIFCGNHKHVMDQFNVLVVTNRVVHYLAKDEYFEGKYAWFFKLVGCIKVNRRIHDEEAKKQAIDVLVNGGSLGLFPEGTRNEVTCKEDKLEELYKIVKDKYTKEELVELIKPKNLKYTQVEYLIELNKKKIINNKELKEYVLDPDNSLKKLVALKKIKQSDYDESLLIPLKFGAVSFASKTGAPIVPFGISGDYTGRKGHLTCRIGKPIVVNDMTLEEANTILSKNIIKLMKNQE